MTASPSLVGEAPPANVEYSFRSVGIAADPRINTRVERGIDQRERMRVFVMGGSQ